MAEYIPVENEEDIETKSVLKYVIIDRTSYSIIVLKYKMENGHTIIGGHRRFFPFIQDVAMDFFDVRIQYIAKDKLAAKDIATIANGAYLRKSVPDTHSQVTKVLYSFKINRIHWEEIIGTFENHPQYDFVPVISHGRLL